MGTMAQPDRLPAAVLHPTDPVSNLGSLHISTPSSAHMDVSGIGAGHAFTPGMHTDAAQAAASMADHQKPHTLAPALLHVQAVAWPDDSSSTLQPVSIPDIGNAALMTQPGMITVGPASPITTPSSLAPAGPPEMGLSTSIGAGSRQQLYGLDFLGSTPFSNLDAASAAVQDLLHMDPAAAVSSGTLQHTQGLPSAAVSDVSLPVSIAHMQLNGNSRASLAAEARHCSPPGHSRPITIASPGLRESPTLMGVSTSSLELQHRVNSIKVNVDAHRSLRTPFEAGLPASATQSDTETPGSPSSHADGGGAQTDAMPFGNVYSPGGTMRSPFFHVLQSTLSSSSLGSTIFGQVQLPGSPNMKGLTLGGDSQADLTGPAGHSTVTITANGMQASGTGTSAAPAAGTSLGHGVAGRSSHGMQSKARDEQVPQLKPQPTVASSTTSGTTTGAANDWGTTTNNTNTNKVYNPMALPERTLSATVGRMPSGPNMAAMRWMELASPNAPAGPITPAPTPFAGSPQPANMSLHQQHMLGLMAAGHLGVQNGMGHGMGVAPLPSGVSGLGTMPSTALTPAKPLGPRNSGNRTVPGSITSAGAVQVPLASFPSGIVRKAAPRGADRQPVRFLALQGAVQRLVTVTGESSLAVYSCRCLVPEQSAGLSKPPRLLSSLTSRRLTRSTSLQPSYSGNSGSGHPDMYSSGPIPSTFNSGPSYTFSNSMSGSVKPGNSMELRVTPLLAGSSATFEAANDAARSLIAPPVSALAVSSGAGAHLVWSGHVDGSLRVWDTRTASPPVWNRKMGGGRPITALCVADDAARGTSGEGHVVWMCDAAGLTAAVAWRGVDPRCSASGAGHRGSGEDPLSPVTLMHSLNAVLPGSDDGVPGACSGFSYLSQLQGPVSAASAEASSPHSADVAELGHPPRRRKWYHGLIACGRPTVNSGYSDSRSMGSSRASSLPSGLLKGVAKHPASSRCMLAKQGLVLVATHGKLMHLLQASSHSLVHSAGFGSYGACTDLTYMRWSAGNNSTGSNGIGGGGGGGPRELLRRRSSALYRTGDTTDGVNTKGPNGAPSRQRSLPGFTWRLLSSHASGTILLWDISFGRCEIVCSINSAGMGHITGMSVAQALEVMITTHKDGRLCLWPLPSAPMVPSWDPSSETGRASPLLPVIWSVTKDQVTEPASLSLEITGAVREEDSASTPQAVAPKTSTGSTADGIPRSFMEGSERGALPAGVLHSLLGAAGGNSMTAMQAQKLLGGSEQRQLSGFPAPAPPPLLQVPAWKVQTWAVQAHSSSITALAVSGACAVTASKAGGIKSWDLMDLCQQAVAAGLVLVSAPQAHPAPAPGQWAASHSQSYSLGVPPVAAPMPGAGPAAAMGMPASATAAAAMGNAGNQPLSTHSHMPQSISLASPEHVTPSFTQAPPGPLGRALSSASLHNRSRSMAGSLMDTPFMSSLQAVAAPAPNRLLGAGHRTLPGTATTTPRDDKQAAGHPDMGQAHGPLSAISRGPSPLNPAADPMLHGTPQLFSGVQTRLPSGPHSDVHLTPSLFNSNARYNQAADVHHHLPPILGHGRPPSGANLAPTSPVHELFAARQYSQHQLHGPLQALYQQQQQQQQAPGSRHYGHAPPLSDQLAFDAHHAAQRGMSDSHSRAYSTVPNSSMETSTSCPPPKLSNTTLATNTSIATTNSRAGSMHAGSTHAGSSHVAGTPAGSTYAGSTHAGSTHAGSAYDLGSAMQHGRLQGALGVQASRATSEFAHAPASGGLAAAPSAERHVSTAETEFKVGKGVQQAIAEAPAGVADQSPTAPSAVAIVSAARNSAEPLSRLAAAVQSKRSTLGGSPGKQVLNSSETTGTGGPETPGTGKGSLLPEVDSLTAVAQFALSNLDGLSLSSLQTKPLPELKLRQKDSEGMAGRHSTDHSDSPFSRSTAVAALGTDLSTASAGPALELPQAASTKAEGTKSNSHASGNGHKEGGEGAQKVIGASSKGSPGKNASWAATTLTGSRGASKGSVRGETQGTAGAGQQQVPAMGGEQTPSQAAGASTGDRVASAEPSAGPGGITSSPNKAQAPITDPSDGSGPGHSGFQAATSPSAPMHHSHPGSRTRRHSTGDAFPGFLASNGFMPPPGWPSYYPPPPPGFPPGPPHPAPGFGWPLHPYFYPTPAYHPAFILGMAAQQPAEPNMLEYLNSYNASLQYNNSMAVHNEPAPSNRNMPFMHRASKRRSMARQGADRIPEDEELHAGSPDMSRAASSPFLGAPSDPYQPMSVQQLQGRLSASFNHYAAYSQSNPYQPQPPNDPPPVLARSSAMLPRRAAPPPHVAPPTDRWWGAVDSRCSSPTSSPRPALLDSHEQASGYDLHMAEFGNSWGLHGPVTTGSWGLSGTALQPPSLTANSMSQHQGNEMRVAHAHSRSLEMESIGWPGWETDPTGQVLQLREHSASGAPAPISWPPYLTRDDSHSSQVLMQSQPSDAAANTQQQQQQQQQQHERTEQEARAAMQVRDFNSKLALMSGSFTQRVHSRDMLAMGGLSAYADKFITKDDVKLVEEVGHGAEGTVWRGRWHHIDVAVKEMHPKSTSFNRLATLARDMQAGADTGGVLDAVVKEVQTLVDVSQHPNIVRFIGVCVEPPRIITEYYPLGSLFSMLQQARDGDSRVIRSLSWPRRLQMLHNIAAGMAYLHSRSYIHGDLRTPNIFVASDGQVKIGDFGFARLLGELEDKVNSRTTNPRWLAPEVLRTGKSSKASDVFSFAIIMWEVLTWQVPYTGYFSAQVTFNHVNDGFRPDVPPDAQLPVSKHVNTKPFRALMEECWCQDGNARPSFSEVASRLSALMHWQHSLATARDRDKRVTRRVATTSCLQPPSSSVPMSRSGSAAPDVLSSQSGPGTSPDLGSPLFGLPPPGPATATASRSPGGGSNARSMRRHHGSRRNALSPDGGSSGPSEPSMNRMSSMAARHAIRRDAGSVSVMAARSLHSQALRMQQAADAAVRAVDEPVSTDNDDGFGRTPAGFGATGLPPRGPSIRRLSRTDAGGMSMLSRTNSMRDHEAAFVAPAMPTLRLTTSITPNATAWLAAVMGSLLAAEVSPRNSRPVSPRPGGGSPNAHLSPMQGMSLLSSPRENDRVDTAKVVGAASPSSSAAGTPAGGSRQSPSHSKSHRTRAPPPPPLEVPQSPSTASVAPDSRNGVSPLPDSCSTAGQSTLHNAAATDRVPLTRPQLGVTLDMAAMQGDSMESSPAALSPTTPSPSTAGGVTPPPPPWAASLPERQQSRGLDGFMGLAPVPEHPHSHGSHSTAPSSIASHASHLSRMPSVQIKQQPSSHPVGFADVLQGPSGTLSSLSQDHPMPTSLAGALEVSLDSRQGSVVPELTAANLVISSQASGSLINDPASAPINIASPPPFPALPAQLSDLGTHAPTGTSGAQQGASEASRNVQIQDGGDSPHDYLPEHAAPSFSLPLGAIWAK